MFHLPYDCHVRPPPEHVDAWISDHDFDRCTGLGSDRIRVWLWIKGSQYKFARHNSGTETAELCRDAKKDMLTNQRKEPMTLKPLSLSLVYVKVRTPLSSSNSMTFHNAPINVNPVGGGGGGGGAGQGVVI